MKGTHINNETFKQNTKNRNTLRQKQLNQPLKQILVIKASSALPLAQKQS